MKQHRAILEIERAEFARLCRQVFERKLTTYEAVAHIAKGFNSCVAPSYRQRFYEMCGLGSGVVTRNGRFRPRRAVFEKPSGLPGLMIRTLRIFPEAAGGFAHFLRLMMADPSVREDNKEFLDEAEAQLQTPIRDVTKFDIVPVLGQVFGSHLQKQLTWQYPGARVLRMQITTQYDYVHYTGGTDGWYEVPNGNAFRRDDILFRYIVAADPDGKLTQAAADTLAEQLPSPDGGGEKRFRERIASGLDIRVVDSPAVVAALDTQTLATVDRLRPLGSQREIYHPAPSSIRRTRDRDGCAPTGLAVNEDDTDD